MHFLIAIQLFYISEQVTEFIVLFVITNMGSGDKYDVLNTLGY